MHDLQSNSLLEFFANEINALTVEVMTLRNQRVESELRIERLENELQHTENVLNTVMEAVNNYFDQATSDQVSDFENLLADAEIVNDVDVTDLITFDDGMTVYAGTDHADEPGWMSD